MEKSLTTLFAIAALVVAGTYFYADAGVPTKNERKLEQCLDAAQAKYRERWIEACKLDKREIGTDGLCLLISGRGDYVQNRHKEDRNNCYQRFPVR